MKQRIVFFLLVFYGNLFSQSSRAIISREELLIGEKATVTYLVELSKKNATKGSLKISHLPVVLDQKTGKKSKNIEAISTIKDTIIRSKNSTYYWIGVISVSAWDAGKFVIESPIIEYKQAKITFPILKFSVSLVPEKKEVQLYDIKQSFKKLPPESIDIATISKNYWWVLILLPLILLLFYWRKRRKSTYLSSPFSRSNHENLLQALLALEKKEMWKNDQTKIHFIELSTLVRTYLSDEFHFHFLEKTTQETTLILKQKKIDLQLIQLIDSILSVADLVKFAKSIPSETEILAVHEKIRACVSTIQQINTTNE